MNAIEWTANQAANMEQRSLWPASHDNRKILTDKQKQDVLALLAQGMTYRKISHTLGVSDNAVHRISKQLEEDQE